MEKKTVVLGASENVERYSNMAVKKLLLYNHPVIAVGKKAGSIGNVPVVEDLLPAVDVDTITLYLSAENQKKFYEKIIALKPKRIIFNPGAENDELEHLATIAGIKTLNACTLVMLSTNQY
jgi:uncharacterized protein